MKTQKAQLSPKWSQKERSKIQPKQPKRIGPICNPITTCSLRIITSIGIFPLFQFLIVICLKCWIPNFLSFKTICDFSQETN